jgi:hypothetical protein
MQPPVAERKRRASEAKGMQFLESDPFPTTPPAAALGLAGGSPTEVRPIPRNIWQILPAWHFRLGYFIMGIYLSLLLTLVSTSVAYFADKGLLNNCGSDVAAFLVAFSVIGFAFFLAMCCFMVLFVKRWLPQYQRTARPLGQCEVAYCIATGMLMLMTIASCIYGLYAARFDDLPSLRACGSPSRVCQGICGTYLLMTFVLLLTYFIHNRFMTQKLRETVQECIRPTRTNTQYVEPHSAPHDAIIY